MGAICQPGSVRVARKLVVVLAALLISHAAIARAAPRGGEAPGIVTGEGVGLDVSLGLVGVFASVNVGLVLPRIGEHSQIGFRGSWSMPAVVVPTTLDSDEVITFLPWMATGSVFYHYGSRVVRDVVRGYFGLELIVGTTVATRSGIIGDNVTLGLTPYIGAELYLSQKTTLFLEGGAAAVFTVVYANEGSMGPETQHGATGFFIRFGARWYLGK